VRTSSIRKIAPRSFQRLAQTPVAADATRENWRLVRAIRWFRTSFRVQGIYAIVKTDDDWWMYVGQSNDIWRRICEHDRRLRRGDHPCFELLADCTGIDGVRWRVLLLEEVKNRWDLAYRERWWRFPVENELEREEHWQRYMCGQRDRPPAH
jgi:hypothetical protein